MDINLNFISTKQEEKINVFKWAFNGIFDKGALVPTFIKDKNTLLSQYGNLPELNYILNNKNDGFYINRIFSKDIKSAYSFFDATENGEYNKVRVELKKIKILTNILPNDLVFYDSGYSFDYSKIVEFSIINYNDNSLQYYIINDRKIYELDLIDKDIDNFIFHFETTFNFLTNNVIIIYDSNLDRYFLKYCELDYMDMNINNKSDYIFYSFVQYRKLLLTNAYNSDDVSFSPNISDNNIFIVSKIAGDYGNNISVKIVGYTQANDNDFKKYPNINQTNMIVTTYINNSIVDEQLSINLSLFENDYIKIFTNVIYNDELNIITTLINGVDGEIEDDDIIDSYIIYNDITISGTILYNQSTYIYNKIVEILPLTTLIIISDDIDNTMINNINNNLGIVKSKFYSKIDNTSYIIPSGFTLIQLINPLYKNIDKYLIGSNVYDYLYFESYENDNKYNNVIIDDGKIIQERLLNGDTITKRLLYNKVLYLITNLSNNMMFKQITPDNVSIFFNQMVNTLNNESNINTFNIRNIKVYDSKIEFSVYITFFDNIDNFVINIFGDFIV